jgi:hypothetical protein
MEEDSDERAIGRNFLLMVMGNEEEEVSFEEGLVIGMVGDDRSTDC